MIEKIDIYEAQRELKNKLYKIIKTPELQKFQITERSIDKYLNFHHYRDSYYYEDEPVFEESEIERDEKELSQDCYYLIYPDIKTCLETPQSVSKACDCASYYRRNYQENCRQNHNRKIVRTLVEDYLKFRIINLNPYVSLTQKGYRRFNTFKDSAIYFTYGNKNYPLALINFQTMSLIYFRNNIYHFIKSTEISEETKDSAFIKIIKIYFNTIEDICLASTSLAEQIDYPALICKVVIPFVSNVNDEINSGLFVKKDYTMDDVRNHIIPLLKNIEQQLNISQKEMFNYDINRIKNRYITLIKENFQESKERLNDMRSEIFQVVFSIHKLMEEKGWVLLDKNSSSLTNIERQIVHNKSAVWKKTVNIKPTKMLTGNKLYYLNTSIPEVQEVLNKYTVKNLYFTDQRAVYSDCTEHPHMSGSSHHMCVGDLRFDFFDVKSFLNSLHSLENLYETINYDSAYNKDKKPLLVKHSSEKAVEALGLNEIKGDEKSLTLEKI